MSNAVYTFILN